VMGCQRKHIARRVRVDGFPMQVSFSIRSRRGSSLRQ
jgi:hypothetical protein